MSMVELAIDQGLAEIGRGFTIVGQQSRSCVLLHTVICGQVAQI
jgi:hypothetical protein